MWNAATFALLVACAPLTQDNVRTVAAIEVVLQTSADRADLLAVLRQQAAADPALHVDDVSDRWEELKAQAQNFPPEADGTLYVGVWRGENDDEQEADVDDMGHKGRVWLTFPKGRVPERSLNFRTRLIAAIRDRWPSSKAIPILPSGALPLAVDLQETPTGYKITKTAAPRYGLLPTSALVAPD
ncbi:hypothetical protein IAG41_22810 [Sphingomonas sp. JC676]|uniref:hypothetical protein n=1 Tax=Sphingomonas sp. JC676 TaxID=2768065 RepID=UPI0016577A3E|nr:hypothetical protein [Sphingomonas sp. JC676]MBC9035232.1 hypothetical protein [Sphingomonas sp. JC676]